MFKALLVATEVIPLMSDFSWGKQTFDSMVPVTTMKLLLIAAALPMVAPLKDTTIGIAQLI